MCNPMFLTLFYTFLLPIKGLHSQKSVFFSLFFCIPPIFLPSTKNYINVHTYYVCTYVHMYILPVMFDYPKNRLYEHPSAPIVSDNRRSTVLLYQERPHFGIHYRPYSSEVPNSEVPNLQSF